MVTFHASNSIEMSPCTHLIKRRIHIPFSYIHHSRFATLLCPYYIFVCSCLCVCAVVLTIVVIIDTHEFSFHCVIWVERFHLICNVYEVWAIVSMLVFISGYGSCSLSKSKWYTVMYLGMIFFSFARMSPALSSHRFELFCFHLSHGLNNARGKIG